MEGAALQRRDAFGGELGAAVDQARLLGAVLERPARDVVVVGLVGLAEVGGVGVGHRALAAHPVQRGAGVEAAREGDADALADGKVLEDRGHGSSHALRMRSLQKSAIFNPECRPELAPRPRVAPGRGLR